MKIKIKYNLADNLLEFFGWITLVILWILTIVNYSELPDTIPIHFDARGEINNYGNKATILALPIIGTFIFVAMTLLNKYPSSLNYPVNINEGNALKQYTITKRLMRYLKFAIPFIFNLIVFQTIQITKGLTKGLSIWLLPFVLGIIFIPIILFTIKSNNNK